MTVDATNSVQVSDASKGYLPDGRYTVRNTRLAFVLSILLHLIFLYLLPEHMLPQAALPKEPEALELELAIIKPEEMRFVEANPDAPENTPDTTKQYSFRNQQAAEADPVPMSAENQPRVDGVEQSQKILEGQLASPAVTPQPAAGAANQNPSQVTMPAALPAKGIERPEFLKERAPREMAEEGSAPLQEVAAQASGEPDGIVRLYQPTEATVPNGDPTQAKPRPRLDPKLIMGPLMQSTGSASQRGKLSINASFSEFGEYQQQFFAAVVTGWYQDIEYYQPIDLKTRVQVRFTMRSDGTVTDVKAVHSTASDIATIICENAISKPKQFRPWTKEMVEVYGASHELTVVFIYQ